MVQYSCQLGCLSVFNGWTRIFFWSKSLTSLATWVRLRRKRKARRATADPFTKVSLNLEPCFALIIGQLCLSFKRIAAQTSKSKTMKGFDTGRSKHSDSKSFNRGLSQFSAWFRKRKEIMTHPTVVNCLSAASSEMIGSAVLTETGES